MDIADWYDLFRKDSSRAFVDKLEYKASKITGDDVVRFLKCQGQLAGLREDSPNADRLAALCPWDKIPAKDLRRLFILQPHFAKYASPPKAKEKKSEKVQKEDKKVKKSPEKQTVSQNREESIQPDLFDF